MTDPDASAAEWRGLIDTAPLGLLTTDGGGTIRLVNSTFLSWLGHERADLVGTRTFQQLLSPGGRIYFDTHIRPALHAGGELKETALELVAADRSRLPVLVNIRRTTGDAEESVEIVVFDATERRRYEHELLRERRGAEHASVQLRMMYEVVSGLAVATTVGEVVEVVTTRGVVDSTGASCSVWLFEGDESAAIRLSTSASVSDLSVRLPLIEPGSGLRELRSGQLIVVDGPEDEERYPLLASWLRQSGRRTAIVAPMFTAGELSGVIAYGLDEPHELTEDERRTVEALALQTSRALSQARVLEAERQSRDRLEKLFRFSVGLSQLTAVDDVLESIIASSTSLLGAVGARLSFVDPRDASVIFERSLGVAAHSDALAPFDSRTVASEVLNTGEPLVMSTRAEYAERFPESPLRKAEFTRVISSPLLTGSALRGVWTLVLDDITLVDADDTKLVQLFMEQAGHALSRAVALEAEIAARRQADTRRRLSEALNRAATAVDVGTALASDGRSPFGADGLVAFVPDGDALASVGRAGVSDEVVQELSASTIWAPEHRRLRHRQPLAIAGPEAMSREFDGLLDGEPWKSAAVVPLSRDGVALGVIVLLFLDEAALGVGERQALWGLANDVRTALARARVYEIDHEVADTLQRSLLAPLPEVPGWHIDAAYEPGTGELIVGGDFYDVIDFPDGRLVVVVGDVVGHGLQSAASMGQLRSATRALAHVQERPAELLTALDEFARRTPGVMYASVFVAMFDGSGSGQYACAGHPYPVLVSPDGRTSLLEHGRSPLLGVGDSQRAAADVEVDRGATLLAYTDGLIERRGIALDESLDRLRADLEASGLAGVEGGARSVIDRMPAVDDSHDDVVVVCLTRTA